MSYFDILFPLNLGPLTYRCPEKLLPSVQPGTVVSAPIRNRITKGLVLRENQGVRPGTVKDIAAIHSEVPVVGEALLRLLLWMAEYYLAPEGVVLRQTIPMQIFSKTRPGMSRKTATRGAAPEFIEIPASDIAALKESAGRRKYVTFLLHSPSWLYEYSVARELIRSGVRNMIVILPDVEQAEFLHAALVPEGGERLCLFHGGLAKGRRTECIEGIISGRRDIIIGPRSALFAPLRSVSLIILLREHSGAYKLEEGLRYHVRDVAVMRGFLEKSAVLLSSITPSVDSYFNALSDKYTLLRPKLHTPRPKVKVIDIRYGKPLRPNISKELVAVAREKLKSGKKMIFVVNRRGYATLLLCGECGNVEDCDQCAIPLVLHRDEGVLKCHYCGAIHPLTDRCRRCGGHHIALLGSGTQRVQEDLDHLLGVETVRFDSDRLKRVSEIRDVLTGIAAGSANVVIGTKMMTRRLGSTDKFSAAAILNIDSLLNFPDFRAAEKAYLELSSVLELVEPAGEMLIQTRIPGSALLRHFRAGDYLSFVKAELSVRKELRYPPYAKLLSIRCGGERLARDIVRSISGRAGVEVLGPVASKERRGDSLIFLKSADRKKLKAAAREVIEKYEEKKLRKIVIDVDPA